MGSRTVVTWTYGETALQIITTERLSPEGIETITHRTGAEFVTRVRELCNDNATIAGELVMPNLDDAAE